MSLEPFALRPLYSSTEAEQAVQARRAGRFDDPALLKLGVLSDDVETDVRRILLQVDTVTAYLNLQPAWIAAQRNDDTKEVDRLCGKLDDLWYRFSPDERAAIESIPLARFVEDPSFNPQDLLDPHHGRVTS